MHLKTMKFWGGFYCLGPEDPPIKTAKAKLNKYIFFCQLAGESRVDTINQQHEYSQGRFKV